MGIDLPILWAAIILFGVMMYVVLDGFDLGIGLLFPLFPDKDDRDVMMNSVAPVWDGNETWLVLGGAGLLAAFPVAYGILLSAFYLPILMLLVGLIFRGVAFEFRFKGADAHRPWWDAAFIGGSALATLAQGLTLGGLIGGVAMRDGRFVGGAFDWLAPFPILCGLGLLATYALLGGTWLIMRTDGQLQARLRRIARPLAWLLFVFIVVVSIWTPLAHETIARRWFTWPGMLALAPVPLLVLLAMGMLHRSLQRDTDASPFLWTLLLVFLGYSGLGISVWPHIVPPDLTIRAAAAPPESMGFALVGALFVIPVILAYTAFSYWVFRGKVRRGDGYH